MQTFFLFALIIASVGLMVIAISKWKIHPFIVMTVIALLVGLIWGTVYPESELTPAKVVSSVKSGFGDIMTSIGIVILCGTIIGTILEKTGAALTMANAILKLVGKKRSVVAMGAMGYVTGIPVFCDSGFVVLSPISPTSLWPLWAPRFPAVCTPPTVWFLPPPAPLPWPVR